MTETDADEAQLRARKEAILKASDILSLRAKQRRFQHPYTWRTIVDGRCIFIFSETGGAVQITLESPSSEEWTMEVEDARGRKAFVACKVQVEENGSLRGVVMD